MPAAEEPAFHTIAIAGLGLIGGSIALGVRERWPSIRLVGIDQPAVLAHAIGSGAIDRSAASIDDIGSPDLVILAAPVAQNITLLRELASHVARIGSGKRQDATHAGHNDAAAAGPRGDAGAPRPSPSQESRAAEAGLTRSALPIVVSDVGGTKRDIVDASHDLPAGLSFVGGHPIGGAERGGFGFARPDLFVGRPWIFTPEPGPDPSAAARLEWLANGLGARPARLDASDHDRLMAYVSHLPQLAASALMATVGCGAADGLRLAGRGLVDTTRLASSPAPVWRDIASSNRDFIGEALDGLIATLTALRRDLQHGEALEQTFQDAGRWRTELMKGRD
jgi:prephenate dehydrogenase